MNKWKRIVLAALTLALAVIVVMLLTYAGSQAQGPFSRAVLDAGAWASSLESRIIGIFRGPERPRRLRWFESFRTNRASLLQPPAIFLGAYDGNLPNSLEGLVSLERSLGLTFPLIHFYVAWGDKPEEMFPSKLAGIIWNLGSLPVINWEPWLVDFKKLVHPQLPSPSLRARKGMAAIARGDYDFYIDRWAQDAARFGKPFFLCFGHEMNDPYRYPWGPPHNHPREYIAAWRHLVKRFHRAGADNVIWVWAPNISYSGYEYYYPGKDVVDWVATSILNFGTVAHWSKWWTFQELFSNKYPELSRLGKPIMISEFGSLAVGGNRRDWYRNALMNLPRRLPLVKALLFFNAAKDSTVTYKKIDWTFAGDPLLVETIRQAIDTWPSSRNYYFPVPPD